MKLETIYWLCKLIKKPHHAETQRRGENQNKYKIIIKSKEMICFYNRRYQVFLSFKIRLLIFFAPQREMVFGSIFGDDNEPDKCLDLRRG